MPKKSRAETREGMVVTTVALENELHHRLALAALEERSAMTELVRRAVREWLDRREQKGAKHGRQR
jgi:Arc/MetJ-type ribon-helix-helix transcriptional regulator